MKKTIWALAATASLTAAFSVSSSAQQAPVMVQATRDPRAMPDGTWPLDPRHSSIIARIGHHGGVSFSVFRFDTISGSLVWKGARPESSAVTIAVDPKSISSSVPGFAADLAGPRFLNTAKYPDATFVSTGIRRTGPTTGLIAGNLKLMGVTRPVNVRANLVGAGKGMRGEPDIGFSGTTRFKRSDFGFTFLLGSIGDEVELVIDLEFTPPPAANR